MGISILDLLSIPLTLLLPVPLKLAVDSLTGSQSVPQVAQRFFPASWSLETIELLLAAGLMLAVGLLQHVLGFANWCLQTYTSERLVLDFRSQLFHHVQRLSLSYHDKQGSSDPSYRIQYDAPAIAFIAVRGAIPCLTQLLTLAGMLYVSARIDFELAMIALAAAPFLFLLTRKFSTRLRRQWIDVKDRDSRAMAVVQEVLNSVRVVKVFGQEEREHGRFMKHSGKYMRGQLELTLLQANFYVFVGMTIAVASVTGLYLGVGHVRAGVLTIGELLMVLTYMGKLYEPLGMVSSKWGELQSSLVSVGRAFALLDEVPEVAEKPSAAMVRKAAGAITFRNVSFHYHPEKPVLRDISFEISPGTHVGICGRTGVGKTTLITLLTRLYDPVSGAILLDGIDLRDYKLKALRDQFTIVLQEPVLFSTTIGDNIAYARSGASESDVIAAAKAANAHEFIMRLPDGYNTEVGHRGQRLSGGERQRISLARAFLKSAPIVILDEPTSSVDLRTEAGIVEATEALIKGRTTFIIAHRTSTLQHCDVQFELNNGKLVCVKDLSTIAPAALAAAAGLSSKANLGTLLKTSGALVPAGD
ncbi:MAG: ABC transporter ATP-binding protein [Terriglobales bacterium]